MSGEVVPISENNALALALATAILITFKDRATAPTAKPIAPEDWRPNDFTPEYIAACRAHDAAAAEAKEKVLAAYRAGVAAGRPIPLRPAALGVGRPSSDGIILPVERLRKNPPA
jgi:hypothetical protein